MDVIMWVLIVVAFGVAVRHSGNFAQDVTAVGGVSTDTLKILSQ